MPNIDTEGVFCLLRSQKCLFIAFWMPLDINSMPKNRKVETKTILNFYARYFTFICNLVPMNGKFSLAATIVCCFTNFLTKNGLHYSM